VEAERKKGSRRGKEEENSVSWFSWFFVLKICVPVSSWHSILFLTSIFVMVLVVELRASCLLADALLFEPNLPPSLCWSFLRSYFMLGQAWTATLLFLPRCTAWMTGH
jgi:hypothetical protein